jgi:NDP-sugar pyrophosphorylase family protein
MQILHKQPEQEINVKAIILAGSRDFGRCPLASRLPLALWPILDKPVLEHLLLNLSHQGVNQATVCSNGDAVLLRNSLAWPDDMQLAFLDEKLPFGTAGCIREAAGNDADIIFVVFHAATLSPPNISELLEIHRSGKSILTVIKPDLGQGQPTGRASEIYVCEPAILEYVSPEGYCDIKESLIAKMLRAGIIANLAVLRQPFENFHDRAGYLRTVANCLEHHCSFNIDAHYQRLNGSKNIWLAEKAMLHPQARVYGPAVIMEDAVVSAHAVIFGPAIIGPDVSIGENCLIENSTFWAGASLGSNSRIRNCVVDYNVRIRPESIKTDQAITKRQPVP